MNEKDIFLFAKDLGCCDLCCLRFLGVRNPNSFEKPDHSTLEFKGSSSSELDSGAVVTHTNGSDEPPSKKTKKPACACCVGVLQQEYWTDCFVRVKEVLLKKQYDWQTFGCALSFPMVILLREKTISVQIKEKFEHFDEKQITPLKEAWKWSFGAKLSTEINKTLDSGAIAPLLITVNMEYENDLDELSYLKAISPHVFSDKIGAKKHISAEISRVTVAKVLDSIDSKALQPLKDVEVAAKCVSVGTHSTPLHVGGRYIKLSRELPQSPWVIEGVRQMDSSVQEIVFQPIAQLYQISAEDVEHRLKFISAGREDVDVRCLGEGRPFVVEISDPRRIPTLDDLKSICENISKDGRVVVKNMCVVTKESLAMLKQGEETKCKTYQALCIKLSHNKTELSQQPLIKETPIAVTQQDIDNINKFKNIEEEGAKIVLDQKTPIRVLHRRPLLTRKRKILDLNAEMVPGHPHLFIVNIKTEAGTYIKEFIHGEFGRTRPCLKDAINANVDILALDVASVELKWP